MLSHRTTARGASLLIVAAFCAAAALASPASSAKGVPTIVFPLIGDIDFDDNYGDARANGSHAGIDIMAPRRTPVVAAEDGKVKWWTSSSRAGCMLYLYGDSGTTYLYIHLNNDLTAKRDNRGKCVPGVAYADGLKTGARVKAGQLIAYNGDSGDAEGTYHLHFEVRPKNGNAVSPFPFLNQATRLLFPLPAKEAKAVTLGLKGVPISAGAGMLELSITAVRVWPGGAWTTVPSRSVELAVPQDALLDRSVATQILSPTRRQLSSRAVVPLLVFTRPAKPTLDVTMGAPGTLSIDRVRAG